ncbi:MAG: endonuclease III [Bacteroidales bacterium]|jgi:endonuclease-3|nr:endonuclease III [Bacteroidales bacterium]
MTTKERYSGILEWFGENVPKAESELNYSNPYELLVAVILSAQCTDKRVNIVTPPLFSRFPTPETLSEATFEEVFSYIKSISYPNNKAKHLIGMARMLVQEFGSTVPSDLDALQRLPGVGRKTANVIASIVYDKPVIAVDTHVFRISRRLGLSKGESVEKVEEDLTKNIPEHLRAISHHWLILHGRYICTAKKPKCEECGLTPWCKSYPLG